MSSHLKHHAVFTEITGNHHTFPVVFNQAKKKEKPLRTKSPVLSDRKSNAGGDVDLQSNFWPLSQLDDIKAKTRSQSG